MKFNPATKDGQEQIEALADVLRTAVIAAWVKENPNHDRAEFCGVKEIGRVGYRLVAAELLARGVVAK